MAVSVWVWVREGVGGCTVVGARVGSVCVYGCVSEWVGGCMDVGAYVFVWVSG